MTLKANGEVVLTAELNAANNWSASAEGLPMYENGLPIEYTWEEEEIPGYEADFSTAGNLTILTNRHAPILTEATVRKVWIDNNNLLNMRPASLTATLSNGMTVTLSDANGWSATIRNLPAEYRGEPIEYSWSDHQPALGEETGRWYSFQASGAAAGGDSGIRYRAGPGGDHQPCRPLLRLTGRRGMEQ